LIGRVFRVVRTPVTLLILFGMLLYGAYWGYHNIIKPIPALPPEPCVDQSISEGQLTTSQVVVRVYNGGDRKGLAADVGRSLRNKGFRVTLTTNTVEKIQKTVIVGADANNPEVKFVKTFFKESVVRADRRVDRTVDVLVGNKYGGLNKDAKTTYQLDTNTICLPSQTPSATPALGG
jgi:LytR cell envelope-related transcriptional attenuator